ncbi:lysylphosphatidylglycerol synthase transmembrane domain-containing protein [Dactylosporangium sp. AC04546]|uniref:lysylphosphatidylglycerol synthase transmembrane domain-containing protein n=1 Tax=Dactylosporangium sp. AC04546 TaxID=2862460 RepID=UPI001EE0C6D7|nr:lysylphosphatidylglycerol synthase transmembrane domain-containing protein [Dactylosporangium sp. AC04546]WVK88721.1 lysylphosphatidylglycerol synthase transmembrane domain-containing protein [Dactylosporangium sp. AC04546]
MQRNPMPPTAGGRRSWGRVALFVVAAAAVVWAASHASAVGASWSRAGHLIAGLGWRWLLVLGFVWFLGLWVHTVVLTASLPGLTHRRALTLNLSGSAVSNVLPLGGLAGTTLNLGMIRGWGHSNLEFARFVVVSKAADLVAKLTMPLVAVVVLLLSGTAPDGRGVWWLAAAGAAAVAGLLVVAALLGRTAPLLRLVAAAERAVRRRRTAWTAAVSDLLDGTDRLVRRRWTRLSWGMGAYWLLQGALLWYCCVAVGLDVSVPVVLAALVAERALTLLAITPGGAGLVEAGTVGVLIALRVDPTTALAAVLLFRAFVFAAEIPVGGLATALWLASRRAARAEH